MTRYLAVLTLAVIAAPGHPDAQTTPGARASSPHLRISAVALDRDDRPVTDLQPKDLEVWIGGYRVPIERVTAVSTSSDDRGRQFVLLLDDTTLAPIHVPRVRAIARRFVNQMAPGDHISVVALNSDTIETSSDRTRLLRSIDAVNLMPAASIQRVEDLGARVLQVIASLSRLLLEGSAGRRTIVAIGAAWLFDRPIPPPTVGRDLRQEWTDAMRATAAAGAHVYVIDAAGVGGAPTLDGSGGFARETGGHAFSNTNDFDGAVDRIMREASTYYVIEVTDPPIRRTADLRELDVRVLRRGITVRTRRAIPGRP
jgi:VWFA-related protein